MPWDEKHNIMKRLTNSVFRRKKTEDLLGGLEDLTQVRLQQDLAVRARSGYLMLYAHLI